MDLSSAMWRKSSRSSGTGQCVEVALNLSGVVAVRDTKDRDGGTLVVSRDAWVSFVAGARDGEFSMSS